MAKNKNENGRGNNENESRDEARQGVNNTENTQHETDAMHKDSLLDKARQDADRDAVQAKTTQKLNITANLTVENSGYVEGKVEVVQLGTYTDGIKKGNKIEDFKPLVGDNTLGTRPAVSSKLVGLSKEMFSNLSKYTPKPLGDILTNSVVRRRFTISSFMRTKPQDQWRILKSAPDADLKRKLELLGIALTHIKAYPKVHEELLKFISKPQILLDWVKPLLSSRVRWGRDFYKDTNYKFTKAELFDAICNTYTSWKPEEGRDLLVFLLMEISTIELAASKWMRDNFSYDLPVRYASAIHLESIQEIMEYNIINELIVGYCELTEQLVPKVGSDKPYFYKGSVMLETDLRDYLSIRRRALSSLLFDIKRTELDVRYTLALVQGHIFDVKVPNLDIIEEVMASAEIAMLSERAEFFLTAVSDLTLLDTLVNISIPVAELKKKVSRVIKYGLESPFFEQLTPKAFLDEITVGFGTTLDGQVSSALLLKFAKVSNQHYKVLRKEKSTISPYLYQYEELSFTGLEALLSTSQLGLEPFKTGDFLNSKAELLMNSKVQTDGLITNLTETELFMAYVALNDSSVTLNLPDTVFSYTGLGTASLSSYPKLVYSIELKPEDRVSFLPINTLNYEYHFNNPIPWILGYFSKKENHSMLGFKNGNTVRVGNGREAEISTLDNLLLSRDYGGALEEIKRHAAAQTLGMMLNYNNVDYNVEIKFSDVLSEQWLGAANVYYDQMYIQILSINAATALALEDEYITSIARELGVTKNHAPIYYEMDGIYINLLRQFAANSLLFKRIFDYSLKSVLQQITVSLGATAKIHAATIYKELSNAVGIAVFKALNDWLEFCPESVENRLEKAIERSVNFKFEAFFI